ncbi:hypothetical protein [Chondromyces crocatus]|uniref:FTP domain-containing protein n=1 Tax=Chondromyces crocatus TaxID=52 RepID=A0A0K1EFI3_CHOCO|nr:hypothetical protein [Chondromyces crocatus]AKT39620.1 uncharacterized protein CMC5_037690 [Chondromyces crocatus]
MHRQLSIAPLTALALILSTGIASVASAASPGTPLARGAASGRAVEWYDVRDHAAAQSASALQAGPRVTAERFLQGAAAELRLEGVDLETKVELKSGSSHTVRFTQTYRGLPVIGSAVAVRVGAGGAPRAAIVDVARGLSVSTEPTLDEGAARLVVEEQLGMSLVQSPAIQLAVLPVAEQPGKLVWMVDIHQGTRHQTRYLVDAHGGGIQGIRPMAMDAMGRVYQISAANTPEPVDVTLTDLVTSNPQRLTGWNGNLVVTNYVSGSQQNSYTVEQSLGPNSGEDFLYDPPADPRDPTDGFAQVNVYYHMTRIRDYFVDTHGVDTSPASWKVTAVANLMENGQPFDNAFFAPEAGNVVGGQFSSPNLLGIYQGTMNDFSIDSDVFLHEFGHYISHNAVGYNQGQFGMSAYGLSPWSGAIDEGIADYFACSLNGNSLLGEASLVPLGAGRELQDTAKVCPDHVVGQVHEDGEIIGSLGWTLRTALGQEIADRLVWGAVQSLTPGVSLGDFARGLLQTADELLTSGEMNEEDVRTVEEAIAARGLDDCDHVLEVTPGEDRNLVLMGLGTMAQGFGISCEQAKGFLSLHSFFHFSARANAGDTALRFSVQLTPVGGGPLEWSIYARRSQSVSMAPSGPLGFPAAQGYDFKVEGLNATDGTLLIDASVDPAFEPGIPYYFVIENKNCPTAQLRVSAESITPPSEGEGGAGGTGGQGGSVPQSNDTPDDSGCGCTVAGDEAPSGGRWAGLLGLGLAAAAVTRRRFVRR